LRPRERIEGSERRVGVNQQGKKEFVTRGEDFGGPFKRKRKKNGAQTTFLQGRKKQGGAKKGGGRFYKVRLHNTPPRKRICKQEKKERKPLGGPGLKKKGLPSILT